MGFATGCRVSRAKSRSLEAGEAGEAGDHREVVRGVVPAAGLPVVDDRGAALVEVVEPGEAAEGIVRFSEPAAGAEALELVESACSSGGEVGAAFECVPAEIDENDMKRKILNQAVACSLLIGVGACGSPPLCTDCDVSDADVDSEEGEEAPGDLPCGGADLQTDDKNCGSCGSRCYVWYSGTEWEAGGCVAGECAPLWTDCESGFATCAERCAQTDQPCIEGGCAGVSGFFVDVLAFDGCNPPALFKTPLESCDDEIDWNKDDLEVVRQALCCCGHP